MENYSRIGGILSIVSGAIGAFLGLTYVLLGVFFSVFFPAIISGMDKNPPPPPFNGFFVIIMIVYAAMGIYFALIGALAIVGGVFSIKKRHWGVALAGSIAASYVFFPCGIAAVIFTSMAKGEFKSTQA